MPQNSVDGRFAWPAGKDCGSNPHRPDCRRDGPAAGAAVGHVDHFCDCHDFAEPIILRNGSDIAWPKGWGKEDAMRWRAEHKLLAVGG